MEGIILNYRRGRRTQNTNQIIIKVPGIDSREEAVKFLNKKITWRSISGKELTGTITNIHGNKGTLRVQMDHNLPGQAFHTKVKIE